MKTEYKTTTTYREKTIVLTSEERNTWAILDEDGDPGKDYQSLKNAKEAVDRKLDAPEPKAPFAKVKAIKTNNPTIVYEVTSLKGSRYGSGYARVTVIEAPAKARGYYGSDRETVGARSQIQLGSYESLVIIEDAADLEVVKKLRDKDAELERLRAEREEIVKLLPKAELFFKKRGDLGKD